METTVQKEKKGKRIVRFWNAIWQNRWYPLLILGIIFTIVFLFETIYTACKGGFLHMNSDDLVQYYPYITGFFRKLKEGTFSLYDKDLFGGGSYFSAAYYIPLDIFTFIAFILSFMMNTETAYCISNYLRPVCGALLLYYTFSRKFSYKAAFLAGLVLFCGGTVESYYIFPVYLGIVVYAPLAMLIIDLCIEKGGRYYYLLSFYSITVIFYDFYIAYMLLAFACCYFVVKMHTSNTVSFFGKNTFIKNKEFYKRYGLFFGFLLLGVAMAAILLVPSALYIIHQTSRDSTFSIKDVFLQVFKPDEKQESYIYFSKSFDGVYKLSIRHYFTQFANLFMPNDPHSLCLIEAGDYIREHASMYLTTGGLVYMCFFFMARGKEANRLKGWVIFVNVLLLFPIFSVILGLNVKPYLRWFFIPYFINLYAMVIGIDNLKEGSIKYYILPTIALISGLGTFIYILSTGTEYFIHYKNSTDLFYLFVIPTIVVLSLYLILFIVFIAIKKKGLINKILPLLVFGEFIFACVAVFGNVENTSKRYYQSKKSNYSHKENLKDIYNYEESDGYRINLYTIYGRESTNSNIMIGETNFGRFFQSFYNPELNDCLKTIYGCTSTSWSRSFNDGYSLLTGPIFNEKYIITNEKTTLPEQYFTLTEYNGAKYYERKNDIPFIVYDDYFSELTGFNAFTKRLAVLSHAYINLDNNEGFEEKYNVNKVYSHDIKTEFEDYYTSKTLPYLETITSTANNNEYFIYDLESIQSSFKDAAYVYMSSSKQREGTHCFMYVTNEISDALNPYNKEELLHFSDCYKDLKEYKYLVVEVATKNTNSSGKIYSYSYQVYDDFIAKQAKYTNKEFSLDGTTMHIKVTMPSDKKNRIIKTGYTYSKEWVPQAEGYDIINVDGGFLGIVVDENIQNVDLTLKFVPEGLSTGGKLTLASSCVFLVIIGADLAYFIWRKKKRVM